MLSVTDTSCSVVLLRAPADEEALPLGVDAEEPAPEEAADELCVFVTARVEDDAAELVVVPELVLVELQVPKAVWQPTPQ